MPTDPIIEFAQIRFGDDAGLPNDAVTRPPMPDWLVNAVGGPTSPADAAGQTTTLPTEASTRIMAEDPILPRREPSPVGDGTTPDALAYYLPFHFYRTAWGIYIRAAGLWALARRLALPEKAPDTEILTSAYNLLFDHEQFHFLAEHATSKVEVVTATKHYDAYFKNEDGALHEEALANAYALRRLVRRSSTTLVGAVSTWMATQGPGYCEFKKWLPPNFTEGERYATCLMMQMGAAMTNCLAGAGHPAEFLFRNVGRRSVPTYIVLDRSTPWIRVAKPFPKDFGLQVYVYSNDHKPPHIHVDCPPGTPRTRYQWPELIPLRGDEPLKSKEEKRLRRYVDVHGTGIRSKITAIQWK